MIERGILMSEGYNKLSEAERLKTIAKRPKNCVVTAYQTGYSAGFLLQYFIALSE